jgi:hypothetical protein
VHIWDVDLTLFTIQRKLILTIEILFVIGTGLIKVSILLFFRRLGSRGVTKTFRVITWVAIGFTIASTITFFISPLVGCRPLSAYWEQSDVVKIIQGTKFNCNDEGAAITAAGVVSTVQDVIAALLPNFIYWKARIPFRQKAALMGIFATAYGVAVFGALRTYATWVLFFETYDVSWQLWEIWNWTLLELHIGVICANAPALKVFVKRYLDIKSVVSKQQSRFPRAKSSQAEFSQARSSQIKSTKSSLAKSSQPKSSQTRSQTSSNLSGKSRSKLAIWKRSYANFGYLSQPTQMSVDETGGVRISEEFEEKESGIHPISEDSTQSERHYPNDDVELGILPNAASHISKPPESHRGSRGLISLYYYDSDSESEIAGRGFKYQQVRI